VCGDNADIMKLRLIMFFSIFKRGERNGKEHKCDGKMSEEEEEVVAASAGLKRNQ
jgi:hypothetical protein